MSHRTKKWLIGGSIFLLIFAPATFMMLIDKGFDTLFMVFDIAVEKLNNIPTAQPSP